MFCSRERYRPIIRAGMVPDRDPNLRHRKVRSLMQKQGALKRQKERARQEKQRDKDASRLERRHDRARASR